MSSDRSDPNGRTPPSAASGPARDAPTAGLTTGAVARRFGVAPTTLRSWDRRYGVGPATREGGRHRRWSPRDLEVLEEMCRLTGSGVPPAEAARAALALRAPEARERHDAEPDAAGAPGTPAPGP
ncbi:MerR family transcriptional regulator, partial [Streptomyces sp. JJ36]|uniref:MerR family transcriptional regulator n=1 Tax=Streptomyces sp. JJ36 TaxID=2736645 RepID=UPI001F024AA2